MFDNKKILIATLIAVLVAVISNAADAAPIKNNNHNGHNNKPVYTQPVKHATMRPVRTRPQPQKVVVVNNSGHHHKNGGHYNNHYGHNNCNKCHNSYDYSTDRLFGAVVAGVLTGGVLYALAK